MWIHTQYIVRNSSYIVGYVSTKHVHGSTVYTYPLTSQHISFTSEYAGCQNRGVTIHTITSWYILIHTFYSYLHRGLGVGLR